MSKRNRAAHIRAAKEPQRANHQHELNELADQRQPSLVRELTAMVLENKKWWLVPILVMVLVLGLIVFLGGTAAAPFIYTLF